MDASTDKTAIETQPGGALFPAITAVIVGALLFIAGHLCVGDIASATTIYSYIDEQGTPVLTDNFENIPERYRAKVKTTEQAPKEPPTHSTAIRLQKEVTEWAQSAGAKLVGFTPSISGLTDYQSRVLSVGGLVAAIAFLLRFFIASEAIRFLALWCLIMAGFVVPALLFTSQDAPLDRLSGQAGKIQEKQQEHLKGTP